MSVVSLLNVITWVFIGLTTIIFCLCFIKLDISGEKSHLSGVECTTLRKVAII